MRFFIGFVLLFYVVFATAQNQSPYPFLPTQVTGASAFIQHHPAYDGDGVLVVIVDSGVDVDVPGLRFLPDGSRKVIDVLDCSGEGDFIYGKLNSAQTESGRPYLQINNFRLYGFDKIKTNSTDSTWYGGVIRESHFKESVLEDLNEDGDSEDVFAYIVFKTVINGKEHMAAVIDLNGDHRVDDEKILLNYRERYDFFHFRNADNGEKMASVTFALNIFPDRHKISLHADDGGHGTHVAGIAAGYRINGEKGYNGIAPGARIISCKIGDNRRSGGASSTGAMVKAFNYGLKRAKELNMPVVFNMSYGIGSVREGYADMEQWLDDFLRQNPDVVVCTSNGNSGPGLSSSGLPASASMVISSGALMAKENAMNVYGATIASDKVFYFSSRGGSVMKPDVLTPGAAASTVPRFEYDENMWGTSMASPQTTGLVALFLSAVSKEKLPIHNQLIKLALKNSGRFQKGYALADQGGGVPDISSAVKIYRNLVKRLRKRVPLYFNASVVNPAEKEGRAQAFFWNDGDLPQKLAENMLFRFRPVFAPETFKNDTIVFESYNIYTTATWLKPLKKTTYIKNRKTVNIPAVVDKKQLNTPGIYSAKIYGIPKNSVRKKENILFENWVTIVVPEKLNSNNNYHLSVKASNMDAGDLKRYFVEINPEIKHLYIAVSGSGDYTKNRLYLFDPEGKKIITQYGIGSGNTPRIIRLSPPLLTSGVYEIDLFSHYSAKRATSVKMDIYAFGADIPEINTAIEWNGSDNPAGKLNLQNFANSVETYLLSGTIKGFCKHMEKSNRYTDFSSVKLPIPQNTATVNIKYTMPDIHYQKMTDVAIQVVDDEGDVVVNTGLNYPATTFSFNVLPHKHYYLETYAGFAEESLLNEEWTYNLDLYYAWKESIQTSAFSAETWNSTVTLAPWKNMPIRFQMENIPPMLPSGFKYWMTLYMQPDAFKEPLQKNIFLHITNGSTQ